MCARVFNIDTIIGNFIVHRGAISLWRFSYLEFFNSYNIITYYILYFFFIISVIQLENNN